MSPVSQKDKKISYIQRKYVIVYSVKQFDKAGVHYRWQSLY